MSNALIPEQVCADVEEGMAAALAEDDLRLAVEAEGIFGVPEGQNDVSLILMLVHQRYGRSWPAPWQGSDTFGPFLDDFISSTIQAHDAAAGRPKRPLEEWQEERLTRWREHWSYQNTLGRRELDLPSEERRCTRGVERLSDTSVFRPSD